MCGPVGFYWVLFLFEVFLFYVWLSVARKTKVLQTNMTVPQLAAGNLPYHAETRKHAVSIICIQNTIPQHQIINHNRRIIIVLVQFSLSNHQLPCSVLQVIFKKDSGHQICQDTIDVHSQFRRRSTVGNNHMEPHIQKFPTENSGKLVHVILEDVNSEHQQQIDLKRFELSKMWEERSCNLVLLLEKAYQTKTYMKSGMTKS